jgi:hypothetical protein
MKNSLPLGFEPVRADTIGLGGRRLMPGAITCKTRSVVGQTPSTFRLT